MKIACSVQIGNRLLPTLAIRSKQKSTNSTLALCKHPKSNEYSIILFTNQNPNGARYGIKGNISQILTRFINEGKATIQFKIPQHDLYLQGDVIQLKSFLHLLRRVLENKILPNDQTCSSLSVTAISSKNIAPKRLSIKARSEYPAKGFPRTLESLAINGIRRCGLDKGILQLTKLKVLDLRENCIEFLPESIKDLHLSELNLASNNFHQSHLKQWYWMSGNLSKSLTVLNLESNDLTYLTNQIIKLQKLVRLNLNRNKLTILPQCIGHLKDLRFLILSQNRLTSLPGSIQNCQLFHLNMSFNDLQCLITPVSKSICEPLPVMSLKGIASRKILQLRLSYACDTIPYTLVEYLDLAKFCSCGQACFDVFSTAYISVPILCVTKEYLTTCFESSINLDCNFCSVKCFKLYRRYLI